MRYISKILSLILFITLIGCTSEDYNVTGIESNKIVNFELLMPIPSSLITRNATNKLDEMVVSPLILLFDEENSLLDFSTAVKRDNTKYWLSITEELAERITTIVVLANYTPDTLGKLAVGDKRDVVDSKMTFSSPLNLENGIPMQGEVKYNKGDKELVIKMKRAVASIDVTMHENLQDVKLKKIYVANHRQVGYFGEKNSTQVAPTPISYEVKDGKFINTLFLSKVNMNSSKPIKDPTLIVAEIEKDNKSYFYRMDFVYKNEDNLVVPFNISSNHKYQFIINEIVGTGWSTVQEAITNSLSYRLGYDLITWKEGIESMWEYDGLYLGVKNSLVLYNDMTSKSTPERVRIQTNMDVKDLVFTSEFFTGVISNAGLGDDTGYIDFYPKENIASIPTSATGEIATVDGRYKRTLQFKKTKDFLEIYSIESSLFGKFVEKEPLTDEHYLELSIAYKSKIDHTFRVEDLPSLDDPKVKITGTIEFDAASNHTTAKLYFSGTPSKFGKVNFKINFGKVHQNSPVEGLNLTMHITSTDKYRALKILIVTKKGGDFANYRDLFTIDNFGGTSGQVKIEKIDVIFKSAFPLDTYKDYHIIYYFDSANVISYDAEDNKKALNRVFSALNDHKASNGGVIYCSDMVYHSEFKDAAFQASKLFFERIGKENIDLRNLSLNYNDAKENLVYRVEKDPGISSTTTSNITRYNQNDNSINVLAVDFNDKTNFMQKLLSVYKTNKFYSIELLDLNGAKNLIWIGSSILYHNVFESNKVLSIPSRILIRQMANMLKEVDSYKYYNEVNKEKYIIDSEKSNTYIVGFRWNVID